LCRLRQNHLTNLLAAVSKRIVVTMCESAAVGLKLFGQLFVI
jgi:hypothetical protein